MRLDFHGEIPVLDVEGEIVFENSNPIKEEAKGLIKRQRIENLVLDLSKVTFVDSSGIGVLISLFKNLRHKNGHLYLAAPTEKVSRVLELTQMDNIFEIYPSLEEAVESVENG